MKTTVILIRHGQSEANIARTFAGHTDAPLSPLGLRQAEATADFIKENHTVDAVYASDLSRAYRTAEATALRFGLSVTPEPAFREIFAGDWEGVSFDALNERYPREYTEVWRGNIGRAVCTGGESVMQLADRVFARLDSIVRQSEGKTIVIGTHATPIRCVQWILSGDDPDGMIRIPWVSNASVTILTHEDGKYKLASVGLCDHLGELKSGLPKNV